jgi:hypothetical protein
MASPGAARLFAVAQLFVAARLFVAAQLSTAARLFVAARLSTAAPTSRRTATMVARLTIDRTMRSIRM